MKERRAFRPFSYQFLRTDELIATVLHILPDTYYHGGTFADIEKVIGKYADIEVRFFVW